MVCMCVWRGGGWVQSEKKKFEREKKHEERREDGWIRKVGEGNCYHGHFSYFPPSETCRLPGLPGSGAGPKPGDGVEFGGLALGLALGVQDRPLSSVYSVSEARGPDGAGFPDGPVRPDWPPRVRYPVVQRAAPRRKREVYFSLRGSPRPIGPSWPWSCRLSLRIAECATAGQVSG